MARYSNQWCTDKLLVREQSYIIIKWILFLYICTAFLFLNVCGSGGKFHSELDRYLPAGVWLPTNSPTLYIYTSSSESDQQHENNLDSLVVNWVIDSAAPKSVFIERYSDFQAKQLNIPDNMQNIRIVTNGLAISKFTTNKPETYPLSDKLIIDNINGVIALHRFNKNKGTLLIGDDTHWVGYSYIDSGSTITRIDTLISTPLGDFNCVEVIHWSIGILSSRIEYWSKGIGLVGWVINNPPDEVKIWLLSYIQK